MKENILRLLQFIAAAILLVVAYLKFIGSPAEVELFQRLGMEPHGRMIIGVVELLAGFLLVTPYAATGALLAVSVMIGAIIAHATILGIDFRGAGMLGAVLVSSLIVLIARRYELPFIGKTLAARHRSTP